MIAFNTIEVEGLMKMHCFHFPFCFTRETRFSKAKRLICYIKRFNDSQNHCRYSQALSSCSTKWSWKGLAREQNTAI